MAFTIGSGDVKNLLSKNKKTKTYKTFLSKFLGITEICYNAQNSPIDALRTGAILEDRFGYYLAGKGYYEQIRVVCEGMDVLVSTLDFSLLEDGKVIEFIELKTLQFKDFIELESIELDGEYIKKKHKDYYNQIQQQLLVTGLKKGNLAFLCVYSYEDDENRTREIQDNEVLMVEIQRDQDVIDKIISEASMFQTMKEYFTK